MAMAGGPLDGIKVLEATQIVAGPFCGVLLADLGADVVKIEPPGGEGTRVNGAFMPGESKGYHSLNRGKRSLVVDLQQPDGQALVHRLIPHFDIFLINMRPTVPPRLRIDYETLRRFRPDLIYIENTGYGDQGPGAHRSGSDIVAQAFSGLMAADAKVDDAGAPLLIGGTAPADYMAASSAAMGACAALFHRQRTGQGQKVSTSLLLAGMVVQGGSIGKLPVADVMTVEPTFARVLAARAAGESYERQLAIRGEAAIVNKSFRLWYGGYRVKDGALILGSLTPANQDQMRRALGIEDDPTRSPDFNALDRANDAIVDGMKERIRAIMLTKTMDEWIALFEREGAPISKVNFPEELADDPQVQAMHYMVDLEHELTGPERMVGPAAYFSESPSGTTRPSPPLGRHTDEVLREHGLTEAEIADLRARVVIA
ncbi:MAG: CoA transferase [Dehalococcoidia bacterium]|nr:CoA transferase [Dehalococcoidia bacterium]